MKQNDLFFLKSVVESNFRRLRFPFKLAFAVTYHCNLRCEMCHIWKKAHRDDELHLNEIEQFFKKANKFSWVGLTGGEPFLREDLFSIADIVASSCPRLSALHFATNGRLTERIVNLVKRLHQKYKKLRIIFTVSMDGPPSLHDHIRGAKGAWDNAMRTFVELKSLPSVKAQIGFTLLNSNTQSFRDTFASIKEAYPNIKFDDINVNAFQKSSFYYENENLPEIDNRLVSEEIGRILSMDNEKFSLNNFLRRAYLRFYFKYIASQRCPLKCQALASSCFLDPYGDLFPCGVYNKKLLNIRKMNGDFRSVWNSRDAKRLCYECSNYLCPGCWNFCDANVAIAGSLIQALFMERAKIRNV